MTPNLEIQKCLKNNINEKIIINDYISESTKNKSYDGDGLINDSSELIYHVEQLIHHV